MKKIIFATKNKDKLKEIKSFFSDIREIEWLSFIDFPDFPDVEEDQATIEDNSQKKAITVAKYYNIPAVSDDSGLFVDKLGGEPGVFSARWAGKGCSYFDNNKKLIEKLHGVEFEERTATFKCAITLAFPNGRFITKVGELKGYILYEMKGTNGFGYDPLFYVPNMKKTLAEMSLEEKNTLSHRFQALLKIKPYIIKMVKESYE
ncbi:MAG: RdgB/HAM1 family non-canonical purine NTP pyrophosphatase [Elusimicrobiales bacterium]|nr:RdgB/HAM1 family non-canonical purine NTP pyrophosphatase [Elusimicrobiales bacterium]